MAAYVGSTFKLDPLVILRATPEDRLIRQACTEIIADARAKAQK